MCDSVRFAVFDLDDTLYPAECGMWLEIRKRINTYMVEQLGIPEADVPMQRERYFCEHGTSLAGLRYDYPDIDTDEYLAYVHDLPYDRLLSRNDALSKMLGELKMHKSVFTNSDRAHALRVLGALGVKEHFEVIIDVHATHFVNKPRGFAFDVLFRTLDAEPRECVLVDDQLRNLEVARSLGMATVLVRPDCSPDGIADYCVSDVVRAGNVLRELGVRNI